MTDQWQPQQYPYQQQVPQQPYGYQPQYPPQPWQQPPVQVNVTQNAYGHSSVAVTQGSLGPFWTVFHLCMTLGTGGLWGFVWWAHYRSRRTVTVYR